MGLFDRKKKEVEQTTVHPVATEPVLKGRPIILVGKASQDGKDYRAKNQNIEKVAVTLDELAAIISQMPLIIKQMREMKSKL